MDLGRLLEHWRGAPRAAMRRRPTPDWVDAMVADSAPPAADDEPPRGCGWFDSSHELNAGLQVTEHLSPQTVANEVPLGWWLDWQTAGGRGSAQPGRA